MEKRAGQDELRRSGFVAIYTRERLKRSSDCGKYINIRLKSIFRSAFEQSQHGKKVFLCDEQ